MLASSSSMLARLACARVVEAGPGVGRVGRRADEPAEAVLDALRLGRDGQVRRGRRQPAGHRGARPRDGPWLAGDEQVHRVDEDVEVGPVSWTIRSGTRPADPRPATARQPARRRRHRARGRARLDLEAGRGDRGIEVGRDLVVGAGGDDDRDVGVGPAAGEARRPAPDGQPGEEHEQHGQQDGQRIAPGDALGDRPRRRARRAAAGATT